MILTRIILLCLIVIATSGKDLGDRLDFFTLLTSKYNLSENEAAIWTCIAETVSNFETSLNSRNETFGVFQISNYWCSTLEPNRCRVKCDNLLNDDITDDLQCAQRIRTIQGLESWSSYANHCKNKLIQYGAEPLFEKRCKWARKFYFEHGISYDNLPVWVCIAEESSGFAFNIKVGSAYGLFQINSEYWCSENLLHLNKTCHIPCEYLLDEQITDDLKCAMVIYNETANYRTDNNGFFAWDAYRKCTTYRTKIDDCFSEKQYTELRTLRPTSKAYTPCELAEDLKNVHNIPIEDIPKYVCIAFHDSRLVTSSTRFGPGHYGLWQVAEFWCGNGTECMIPCSDLQQPDITQAVQCAKKVSAGFNEFKAWGSYQSFCTKINQDKLMSDCPGMSNNAEKVVKKCKGIPNFIVQRFDDDELEEDCD